MFNLLFLPKVSFSLGRLLYVSLPYKSLTLNLATRSSPCPTRLSESLWLCQCLGHLHQAYYISAVIPSRGKQVVFYIIFIYF